MKLIKPKYEFVTAESTTKLIEKVARTCYKSESKIADGTDIKMVQNLLKREHEAVIEFSNIIIEIDNSFFGTFRKVKEELNLNGDIKFTTTEDKNIISGNIRSWREFFKKLHKYNNNYSVFDVLLNYFKNNYSVFFEDIILESPHTIINSIGQMMTMKEIVNVDELTKEEKLIHWKECIKFTIDRGVSHELVRHRKCSFAQESTRYCNYGKEGEVTFIIPPWLPEVAEKNYDLNVLAPKDFTDSMSTYLWLMELKGIESTYLQLLQDGWKPQQARSVLPNSLKTEINVMCNLEEFDLIFNLRCAPSAHPQIREVMLPLLRDMYAKYPECFEDMYKRFHKE